LQKDTQILTIAEHKGLSTSFVVEIDNLKLGEGISGQVVQTGETLVVQDLSTDPRLTRSVVKESGFRSLAIAPLVSRRQVLGTLFVITSGIREFSQQDIKLLTSIGDQIGVVVENAHLYEQAQQTAVLEERNRLARELHDSVTQSIYSLTLFSHAAHGMAKKHDDDRLERQIGQIGNTAVEALKEMRLLVYELRPPVLKKEGLIRALRQRLEAVEGRSGVEARLAVDELGRLPQKVEHELYHITNEALNNALKHAAASSVAVYLREKNGLIELEVVDDGIGFDPEEVSKLGGMGLKTIRERVESLGGNLTIHSVPGEGSWIKVTVNIQEEQAK
jgi:signal transduction histidine kinase